MEDVQLHLWLQVPKAEMKTYLKKTFSKVIINGFNLLLAQPVHRFDLLIF